MLYMLHLPYRTVRSNEVDCSVSVDIVFFPLQMLFMVKPMLHTQSFYFLRKTLYYIHFEHIDGVNN